MHYCVNSLNRERLKTIEVQVGKVAIGGENPIRLQSMTTTDTMDTQKSVEQSIRMIDAGCELVRLTAPSKAEATNLGEIKKALVDRGYHAPLVADIHFTPNAAEIAAGLVEKVRVNPGNYADKKKFEEIEYTNESYEAELARIEEKFTPLVLLCKKQGTAMRIGTNHGSLSDRILSRFGDTPEGMVASAMEFIRICEKNQFNQLVISMKASNTIVMVQAYRKLVAEMLKTGKIYPIHLGVTEAGEGEDGRIKSAVGIGAMLEDGIGDTVRVSLTEEPEEEIPIARKLVEKFAHENRFTTDFQELTYDPYTYHRIQNKPIRNIGNGQVPVVIADFSSKNKISPANFFSIGYNYSTPLDKWNIMDMAADYVYIGENNLTFELPGTLGVLCSFENWSKNFKNKKGYFPFLEKDELDNMEKDAIFFLKLSPENPIPERINDYNQVVVVLETKYTNKTHLFRKFRIEYDRNSCQFPVILKIASNQEDKDTFQLYTSSDLGSSLIDGFGDGVWLSGPQPNKLINSTAFGILQATRTRISKTEYISCPSCGRTLFDLQETTAKIRAKTAHLKGLKIGIMGCIVNGPGEMADADYGYVGSGPNKINLYKEKNLIKRNIPEDSAVNELIELIKSHGDWQEKK
jgi:(E)-4-hydroxy-3-methylbut-2-enyl-diphosphate synthase